MQQYIYGNLNHAGFRTVSSDSTGFFMNNAGALSPLMFYDAAAGHGELTPGAHKSFWMLTTDLNIPGGQNYLFLQESGMETFRAAAVVQGYRSDFSDGDLHGNRFLELLDAQFLSSEEALKCGENNALNSTTLEQIPKNKVEPEAVSEELLSSILLSLFWKRRVIIRIPYVGAEAMRRSRGYLKTIYQCLPYEKRRNNGCVTGASAAMLNISKAFTIILMDGDADVSGIASNSHQEFFDLTQDPMGKIYGNDRIRGTYYEPLLNFLVKEPVEKVNSFFEKCPVYLENDNDAGDPDIRKYCGMLKVFQIGRKELAGQEIREWAVSLRYDQWSEKMQEVILDTIAQKLQTPQILEYFQAEAPRYDDIHRFGRANHMRRESNETDENAELSVLMLQRMYARVNDSLMPQVISAMAEHFVSAAQEAYPCLNTQQPMAATLKECDAIRLPEGSDSQNSKNWLLEMRAMVREKMSVNIAQTKTRYKQQSEYQLKAGVSVIRNWFAENAASDLSGLYQNLEQYYLYEEMIGQWNSLIAKYIVEADRSCQTPNSIEEYRQQLVWLQHMHKCFLNHGGEFAPEQSTELNKRKTYRKKCIELGVQQPEDVHTLKLWHQQAQKAGFSQDLMNQLRLEKAERIMRNIPDGLKLQEIKNRLVLAGEWLPDANVFFEPWNIQADAAKVLACIQNLEEYRKGMLAPNLKNRKIREWIPRMLPHNKDLMILLIQKYPGRRDALLSVLAQKGEGITAQDLKDLYIFGCSRQLLCDYGDIEVSGDWREAVRAFLPELPKLPRPLEAQPPREKKGEKILLPVICVLLGIAACIPAAIMMIAKVEDLLISGIVAAVIAAMAGCLVGTSFAAKSQSGKRFLLGLAIAVAPGLLATIALLVLCLL